MNKMVRKTVTKEKNDCDDDDGEVDAITKEDVPPNLRCNYVKCRRQFPSRGKRGRSDGNKTNENVTIESEP